MAYNGCANWETWNVCLWFDNDEGLYNDKLEFVNNSPASARDVEAFVTEMLPNGTPDFDSPKEYEVVDWDEIAEAWAEDADEGDGQEEEEIED